tara:strand:- start:179 stop:325 length:147 start_codon:yes stop_codon:yes gene_type:complete
MIRTIGRFIVGAFIGIVATSVFTNDPRIVMVVAVLCGVAVDKLLKGKE